MADAPNWIAALFAKGDDEIVTIPYAQIEEACSRLRINPPDDAAALQMRAGDLKAAMRHFSGEEFDSGP